MKGLPGLILLALAAGALFAFSGFRRSGSGTSFTPPPGGPTARPQPITSTRPTVRVGEEPPGGISFGSRDPLPIPSPPRLPTPTPMPTTSPMPTAMPTPIARPGSVTSAPTRPGPGIVILARSPSGRPVGGRTVEAQRRVETLRTTLATTGLAGPLSSLSPTELAARATFESFILDVDK